MISQAMLDFLGQLKENNNKLWFDLHRKSYDAARNNVISVVEALLVRMGKWEEGLQNNKAKDCIFRINRDIRFSANKDPYKTNMGAWMNPMGKHSEAPGYYIHIEPGASFLAGGMYQPSAQVLKLLRQEIDYNLADFEAILKDKKFADTFGELGGEKLKTAPKDYAKDHPGIEYLKHKSFVAMHKLTDAELMVPDAIEKIEEVFKTMKPMNDFLGQAVVPEGAVK